jgi:secondary thiamine-phosphate synthase enzyme
MWLYREIAVPAHKRGFHLVTNTIVKQLPEIKTIETGLLTLLLKHTSASLSINENADPTVRVDLEEVYNRLVPENESFYKHVFEGEDDLPAHIKSSLLGVNLILPISSGQLALGQWQGIVLGEHRNEGGPRRISATISGQEYR